MIEVVRAGPLATVQDLGRSGYAHLGVPPSGAADPASFRLANRLVGNEESFPGLEITLGATQLRFHSPAWVALAGAPLDISVDGRAASMDTPVYVRRFLDAGTPVLGARTYLAIRGGLDVARVLGSAATDMLSGLGTPPLTAGTSLPVGPSYGLPAPHADTAPTYPLPSTPVLRLLAGPRDDWLTTAAAESLRTAAYTVTQQSNRVGLRLSGPTVGRGEGELPSEGIVTGGLQVPPDGQPILFLTDHPTTGGYPVVAVLVADDLPVAGQLRPGTPVQLHLLDLGSGS